MIGHGIVVTILRARDGQARLGFTAPADIRVDREEVYQRRAAGAATEAPPAVVV
jgi:carbon storage regulator CsrA